ncbi:MAG: hypothetical protein Q8N17_15565 [Burkholderiaceae bacterium]|nr:hypothetical protein [Burkholderiaceae bacterium]
MGNTSIEERLVRATVASCSCMTKTPAPHHHDEMCRYRLFMDAYSEIVKHKARVVELEAQMAQSLKPAAQRPLSPGLFNK